MLTRRFIRALARRGLRAPGDFLLSEVRHTTLEKLVVKHQTLGTELGRRIARGDACARQDLERLGNDALVEMQREVASTTGLGATWSYVDRAWRSPHAVELLDRPSLDPRRRSHIVDTLDQWNRLLGSYDIFFDELRPLFREKGPTTVVDLASGHAGFALHILRLARREGIDLRVTATDLCEEYLRLGRLQAESEGLELETRTLDASDLSRLPHSVDVFVCTQALHHFSAGQIAVMFESAARNASKGVVFIDASRSALHAITMTSVGLILYGAPDFVHDGVTSLRRCYYPEELALLARLGEWGEGVEARWIPPSHCLLRLEHSNGAR